MADPAFLIKGCIIGFSIAAPVGPIGILCIRRTLSNGRASGFVSGLGAATADGAYGTIAAFGLTAISDFLINQSQWLHLIGGIFLCYLGVKTFFSRPAEGDATPKPLGLLHAYGSTLLLTLTNPTTILSFIAVFTGLGLATTGGDYYSAVYMVGGVALGSTLWWLILSFFTSLFRERFTPSRLVWVNRISGAVILGFGVFALLS